MSTAGSGPGNTTRTGPPSPPYTPPAEVRAPAAGRRRTAIFRWRGIIPLALFLVLVLLWWLIFGDRVARSAAVEAATKALGTQVDIASLRIDEATPAVTIRGLQIADPFDPMRNLLDAELIHVELEPRPLLERKIVVSRLVIRGARAGAQRTSPAAAVTGGGFAPAVMTATREWAAQFDVPLLSLTPVDTIRAVVLNPAQLASVQGAAALKERADSVQATIESGWRNLRLDETLDSTRALANRLSGVNPLALGVDGTRRAVADLRRGIQELEAAKQRVELLERQILQGSASLTAGVRGLDEARRADYAFARGLLQLPTFDAPQIGSALFGEVSIARFQQALYWAEIAERYVPPGLRPRATEGPSRPRMAGVTARFPKEQAYPALLLRQGDIELSLGGASGSARYGARLTNLTTEQALVGEPTRFILRRLEGPASGIRVNADALLDTRGENTRTEATVAGAGVSIPAFNLPMLPLQLDPRAARMQLRFAREGDRIAARWQVASDSVAWLRDAARDRTLNAMESLVARVLTGIRNLELTAELEGDLRSPRLSVRSNLDRAVAERLRAIVGEEVARAEARIRAQVDSIVEHETAPIRARVASLQRDAEQRVNDAKARLDRERAALEARLRSISAGMVGSVGKS